jgi:hypothetical protein
MDQTRFLPPLLPLVAEVLVVIRDPFMLEKMVVLVVVVLTQ